MKPIWYFVGLILMIIGILVLFGGILDFINPPNNPTILAHIHPGIWWGMLMIIFGLIFLLKNKNIKIE